VRKRSMRRVFTLLGLLGLPLAFLTMSGCGYHMGSLVSGDVRTVHVQVFDNATFRRGLELQLTEAVLKEIRRRSHLRIADRAEADSILTGEIVDFRGRVETRDVEDEVFSEDVTVYVNFKWSDRRTGRLLAEGVNLKRPVRLFVTRGDTLPAATSESFRRLAELIVDRMEEGW